MRNLPVVVAAVMFLQFVVARTTLADGKSRPANEVAMSLTVNEAVEEGPIRVTVSVKNLSKDTLEYYDSMFSDAGWCRVESDWKQRKEPPFRWVIVCGNVGPHLRRLGTGETATKTAYLQKGFLSIPPGKVTLRYGWSFSKVASLQKDSFVVENKETIEIKPATKTNLSPIVREREAALAEAIEDPRGMARIVGGAWDRWAESIDGCRQKEFVPQLIRAVDRMPTGYWKNRVIETLHDSFETPEESFAVLKDYLSSKNPAGALDLFSYWEHEQRAHEHRKERREKIKAARAKAGKRLTEDDKFALEFDTLEEEAWQTAKRHLDTRLTPKQIDALRSIKDVWVRALFYVHFHEKCPSEWVEALHKDLAQSVRPAGEIAELVAKLDHDKFTVREQASRELLERFRAFPTQFHKVDESKLSVEAQDRLRRVRSNLEKAQLPELWSSAISHFAWNPDPRTTKLLDILRTSDCRNSISRAAQEALEEREKRDKERAAARKPDKQK